MTSVASFLIEIPTTGEEEVGVNITLIAAVAVPICVVVLLAAVVIIAVLVWKCLRRRKKTTPIQKMRRKKTTHRSKKCSKSKMILVASRNANDEQ